MKLLVKLGGTLLESEDATRAVATQLAAQAREHQIVVVHGGGKQLSRHLAARGIESRFLHGLRVTTPETLESVVQVLAGEVNLRLVAALVRAGARAVGLTGADAGLVEAVPLSAELGAVGSIERVRPGLLDLLVTRGYLPVVACLAAGRRGEIYNVNADEMAVACAVHSLVDRLLFLTDVEGVLDAEKRLLTELTATQAEQLISQGVARGGMEAKLRACGRALAQGIPEVWIAPWARPGALEGFLEGHGAGTAIVPDPAPVGHGAEEKWSKRS